MAKKRTKRDELSAYLTEAGVAQVTETEWEEARRRLAPISDSHLRRLLRESGLPLAALVDGVRQGTLEDLEHSLGALQAEYEAARDSARAMAVRRAVISAKEHARWAMRSEEKREIKQEMLLWMDTWLGNPALYRQWLELRNTLLLRERMTEDNTEEA